MGYILEDKHGIGVELRQESLYITESFPEGESEEERAPHLFLYGETVEMTYDFLRRLIQRIQESEEIRNRLYPEKKN